MKTWKKIEETKKRTGDICTLKKRNEDKVQNVSTYWSLTLTNLFVCLENHRHPTRARAEKAQLNEQLHDQQAQTGRKEKSIRSNGSPKERGS